MRMVTFTWFHWTLAPRIYFTFARIPDRILRIKTNAFSLLCFRNSGPAWSTAHSGLHVESSQPVLGSSTRLAQLANLSLHHPHQVTTTNLINSAPPCSHSSNLSAMQLPWHELAKCEITRTAIIAALHRSRFIHNLLRESPMRSRS